MESFSGGYFVDTSANPPDRPIFGPYENPVAQIMQASTGFVPVYGAHMESAEHCATCHNLYTPYVDAQGNVLGEFPEQTPYTEWQHSSFGASTASCQSCHMLLAQGSVIISTVPPNLPARQPFYQHFSRRAWLHVTVADAAGQVVFESGKPNPDGTIAGNDADTDPLKFEPHYDLITAADQVQIYEPIMGDNEGKVTYRRTIRRLLRRHRQDAHAGGCH